MPSFGDSALRSLGPGQAGDDEGGVLGEAHGAPSSLGPDFRQERGDILGIENGDTHSFCVPLPHFQQT